MITSKNNPQLKAIRKLMDSAKARKEEGAFVAEGLRLVSEVPEELLRSIFISESVAEGLPAELKEGAETVSDEAFRAVSDTVNPQGILAVVGKPSWQWQRLMEYDLLIMLDDIRDPGNLGTIIRTAEAAGAAVIMSPGCADIFNPKVIRSTMGSIFRVPFIISPLDQAIEKLKKSGAEVYAAALDGAEAFNKINYSERRAFIIGNEANGISKPVLEAADKRIFIPMQGKVESLNAAVSAAILMYYGR